MIRDLDSSLAAWLGDLLPRIQVTFDRPAAAPHKGPKPLLHLFLANVREDLSASSLAWTDLRGDNGVVVGRVPPIRRLDFAYLIMASASDALGEHDALGRVLAETVTTDRVPEKYLTGSLTQAEDEVKVRFAPAEPSVDPQHLWSAWGVAPRTSLELHVLAPLLLDFVVDVAPPPGQIDLGVERTSPRTADREEERLARPKPVGRIHES